MARLSSPFRRPPRPAGVADRLHAAAIHLLRRVRVEDAASGVGPARLSALSVLVFAGPQTLGSLAAAEQVRPPTMTRIVSGLLRSGLVTREVDSGDRRVVRVRATRRGRELLQRGRRRRIAHLAKRLRGLSGRELALLERAAGLIERAVRDGREEKKRD